MNKKEEIDLVVKRNAANSIEVIAEYSDRLKMLEENPTINKERWFVLNWEDKFIRLNEISGKDLVWSDYVKDPSSTHVIVPENG